MSNKSKQKFRFDEMIESRLEEARGDLDATIGATGSGTVACRLWHSLDKLVGCLEDMRNKEDE